MIPSVQSLVQKANNLVRYRIRLRYEGDNFSGNRTASRGPEQEVQEKAPGELPTSGQAGIPTPAPSSCCLQVPGRQGRAPEKLREAAEHGLHLCLEVQFQKGEIKEESGPMWF